MNGVVPFSVVVSTYSGDEPAQVEEALWSIHDQTVRPSEIVIVEDGPTTAALASVVSEFEKQSASPVRVIRLPVNQGRGIARNAGIQSTKHSIVAIMDADDVAMPQRFELELGAFDRNPGLGFVCGFASEFEGHKENVRSIKRCPEHHDDIVKALRFTCAISNPTCMFKKELWARCGGFPTYRDINEDYLFYLRLMAVGCRFHCVQRPVLHFRISNAQQNRRRGWNLFKQDVLFRRQCVAESHISWGALCTILPVYFVKRLSPAWVSRVLHSAWRLYGRLVWTSAGRQLP